ncbi:MAG: C25 family cysteine peptidase [Chloroflexota bacterium]
MTHRQDVIHLIHASRIAGRFDFARTVAAEWLAHWPGDHEVQLLLAQAEIEMGLNRPACTRLSALVAADPEFVEPYDLLASALRAAGDPVHAQVFSACASALRGESVTASRAPSWAVPLSQAVRALDDDPGAATAQAQQALPGDPDLALPTLVAMRARLAANEKPSALALARAGHDRWPECIAFRLILADDLLAQGQTSRGVDYLHRAAADDPLRRICDRYLGPDHPYHSLWPDVLAAKLDLMVPAEVAAVLGENRLTAASSSPQAAVLQVEPQPARQVEPNAGSLAAVPASQSEADDLPQPEPWEAFRGPNASERDRKASPTPEAEALLEARRELDRVAARIKVQPKGQDIDRRLPAYIVASCRTRLVQEFGEDSFRRIDEAVMTLVEVVRKRHGWPAYRLYLDDPQTLRPFGLTPADPQNAWQLKLRLADLDRSLARRSEMIGALLIVGGDRIVPFHTLPNPTDDDDEVVPSDNPYATTDENYFAPEWLVGRLPADHDPDLLVQMLRAAIEDHRTRVRSAGPIQRLRAWLAFRVGSFLGRRFLALGYSANIWRKASLAVFRAIGDPAAMLTSPPVEARTLPPHASRPVRLSYFNLHGVEDAPEWFGQRDPVEDPEAKVEYPVALRPQDVVNGGRAPRVVYTEACYGANIAGKTAETALCLKFLASGSRAVVGSTKISYGSVTPPLIGADFLGRLFWENLNRGFPAGEALRRAKLGLAAEMHRRQGFLDGEDQKTLISFVLYGDPLYRAASIPKARLHKTIVRRTQRPSEMRTSCALGGPCLSPDDLDPATVEKVKSVVARYLPGMSDAACRVHNQQCGCDASDHTCPTHQLGQKSQVGPTGKTLVVTLAKSIQDGTRHHAHLARLTLEPGGRVLKLAVSR